MWSSVTYLTSLGLEIISYRMVLRIKFNNMSKCFVNYTVTFSCQLLTIDTIMNAWILWNNIKNYIKIFLKLHKKLILFTKIFLVICPFLSIYLLQLCFKNFSTNGLRCRPRLLCTVLRLNLLKQINNNKLTFAQYLLYVRLYKLTSAGIITILIL